MITGAHTIIYSTNAEADRDFFRDVLKFPSVDVGRGWLIFGLPPAEAAVHPHERNDLHELFLMCDEIGAFVAEMQKHGVSTTPVHEEPGVCSPTSPCRAAANWASISRVMPGRTRLAAEVASRTPWAPRMGSWEHGSV